MMINSKTLAQTLWQLSQREDGSAAVKAFFEFLEEKNFLGLLPQIKNYLSKKREELSQTETLVISSKHDLNEAEIKKIISLVGAESKVETKIIKDESLLGGFSATYRGHIYDGSLKNQITRLKLKLSN